MIAITEVEPGRPGAWGDASSEPVPSTPLGHVAVPDCVILGYD